MIDTRIIDGFNITCQLVKTSEPVICRETDVGTINQQTVLLSYEDTYAGVGLVFTVIYHYQLCQDIETTTQSGLLAMS